MSGASPLADVHAHGEHLGNREPGSATPLTLGYMASSLLIKNDSRFSVRITNVTFDPFDYAVHTPAGFNGVVIAPGSSIRRDLQYYEFGYNKYFELSIVEASTGKEILRSGVNRLPVASGKHNTFYWGTVPQNNRVMFDGVGLDFRAVGETQVLELVPV